MLSEDERNLLAGVYAGWSNREMASIFGWPEQEVAQRIDRLLQKLKLSSKVELMFYACTDEGKIPFLQLQPE